MRDIVYYVASSIDGYICGPEGDISGFVQEGEGVNSYFSDLSQFDTVIMGRNTYEFGYRYGLKPGQPAYPGMRHYIFSNQLQIDDKDPAVEIVKPSVEFIKTLKGESGKSIYLCGGGHFAGWMLENELIDTLKIKLNPLILNHGVPLFGSSKKTCKTTLTGSIKFDDGLHILTYQLNY